MSGRFLRNIIQSLDGIESKYRKRTPSMSNFRVIAGVVIIIVFFIVFVFFI